MLSHIGPLPILQVSYSRGHLRLLSPAWCVLPFALHPSPLPLPVGHNGNTTSSKTPITPYRTSSCLLLPLDSPQPEHSTSVHCLYLYFLPPREMGAPGQPPALPFSRCRPVFCTAPAIQALVHVSDQEVTDAHELPCSSGEKSCSFGSSAPVHGAF